MIDDGLGEAYCLLKIKLEKLENACLVVLGTNDSDKIGPAVAKIREDEQAYMRGEGQSLAAVFVLNDKLTEKLEKVQADLSSAREQISEHHNHMITAGLDD